MDTHCSYISYHQTGYFSKLVTDYLNNATQLQPFYNCPPTIDGIRSAIAQRKNFQHREVLVQQLQKQYQGLSVSKKTSQNIKKLLQEDTFTITTAHQPNIFTGPLYVIYKIFHAIKLSEELNRTIIDNEFVPVYFMGSEDADLAELNNITINDRQYLWQTKQTGAVGRMNVDNALLQLLNEIEGQLNTQAHGKELTELFRAYYKEGSTIQQSTFGLLNRLFGEYGLIVLIPDDPSFKKLFQPVIEKELTEQFSHKAVAETAKKLEEHYKVQASGRQLNLFYLVDDKRERIEMEGLKLKVEGSNLEWDKEEILQELNKHPERFSPNVILRGAYQETILPNVAFIGGGGELAYWLELKQVFKEANVPYPVLILRNSFLLAEKIQEEKLRKLGLQFEDIFKDEHQLMKKIIASNSRNKYALNGELSQFEDLYNRIQQLTATIDPTLQDHVAALKTKTLKRLVELEKKMLRAEKRKFITQQQQIHKIRTSLFPNNNLQERIENFSGFYARYGKDFLGSIYQHSQGLKQQFGIITF